jgi:hypothetical protein
VRRAPKVDANQAEVVAALRSVQAKVHHTHMVADGFPDLVVGHHETKRIGLLEVKDGKKPPSARAKTEDQIKFFDLWAGFPIGLVCDVEGALRFYRMLGSIDVNQTYSDNIKVSND